MLTALCRGATFGVIDGTSLIANGVLTPKGSFWQETFNASGNITGKGPRGSPLAQQDYFRLSKCPTPPQDQLWQGQLVNIHNTIWKVSLTQQNRSTTYLNQLQYQFACIRNLLKLLKPIFREHHIHVMAWKF